MHIITEYKQQLGKLSFVFAASRSYDYHAALRNRRPITSHATSKMPPVCKSDVLLSPFRDALMLQHLLHWHWHFWHVLTERKAIAERGAPSSRWGLQVHGGGPKFTVGAPGSRWRPQGDWGRGGGQSHGGPQNFMTPLLVTTHAVTKQTCI